MMKKICEIISLNYSLGAHPAGGCPMKNRFNWFARIRDRPQNLYALRAGSTAVFTVRHANARIYSLYPRSQRTGEMFW
jgi:hypothetical protein